MQLYTPQTLQLVHHELSNSDDNLQLVAPDLLSGLAQTPQRNGSKSKPQSARKEQSRGKWPWHRKLKVTGARQRWLNLFFIPLQVTERYFCAQIKSVTFILYSLVYSTDYEAPKTGSCRQSRGPWAEHQRGEEPQGVPWFAESEGSWITSQLRR